MSIARDAPSTTSTISAWAPFAHTAFAVLWATTVVSNVGTWMHDVGAGWLMTELSPSPLVVAGVQAATTLPVFLFALLAGALADIIDRRRLLTMVNAGMAVAAALLATLVAAELMTPWLLLVFTFVLGTGAAFVAPAWQAIVPTLVPREALQPAIALNSMGINISRAIGPALAGALIVSAGLAMPFAMNAVSFIGIVLVFRWTTNRSGWLGQSSRSQLLQRSAFRRRGRQRATTMAPATASTARQLDLGDDPPGCSMAHRAPIPSWAL